jgi:integrase
MAPKKEISMIKNFNSKIYQGKQRIYQPVAGAPNVLRLFVWCSDEYKTPEKGKCYEARRWEPHVDGMSVRRKKSFDRLEDARAWQRNLANYEDECSSVNESLKLKDNLIQYFWELVNLWRKSHFPTIQSGTQRQYEKLLKLHFSFLMNVPILQLTPSVVDAWIDRLKDENSNTMKSKTRKSFDHELTLLSTILKFCVEYDDEVKFRFPIKGRHRKAISLNRKMKARLKKISEQEYRLFLSGLAKDKYSSILVPLALTQYYEALRISEAAALHWEDVIFNHTSPRDSYIRVSKKVDWPRKKGESSFIAEGFKNSKASDGVKELPMFPRVHETLSELRRVNSKGLVFQINGKHLEYHTIKNAYDRAFKRAGLPHKATHIMRHGGCQLQYEKGGDLDVAKQLLGNTNMQSVLVYAQRSKGALTKLVKEDWEKNPSLVASGRKLEIVR